MTKRCRWCSLVYPLSGFDRHKEMKDGHLNKCKSCVRLYQRQRVDRLSQDPEWLEKERKRCREKYDPQKVRRIPRVREAGTAVSNAIRDGRLQKATSCEQCGHDFSKFRCEAHHRDYTKLLEVVWLCAKCHGLQHRLPY